MDNIGVDSRKIRQSAAFSEADNAVLQPRVALFADQRTTGVALTCVLAALHVPGTQHVLRQLYRLSGTQILGLTDLVGNYRNNGLPEDAVISRLYICKQATSSSDAGMTR